jgi:phosphoglycolate phosphatase
MELTKFAVIFDMDGTLLRTEEVALPAFKRTFQELKEKGEFQGDIPSDDQLTGVFGMTLEEIWNQLLPGQPEELKKKADRRMLAHELAILKEGGLHLYPEVKETLKKLQRQGISLFIASNGLDEYIRGVCECFALTDFFKDVYSAGRFQTESKDDLVAKLLQDYRIEKGMMVGDRKSDVQAGLANQLHTVGCNYGFSEEGELDQAHQVITCFSDLFGIVQEQINLLQIGQH